MIPTRRSGIAFAGGPVLEPVADHDQRAFTPSGRLGFARRRRFDFNWPVVLGHGFERAQEFPTRRRDLPPLVIAQHMARAKDIDGRHAARETLDACVPVRTAGCEDGDVSFEGSKRGSAATVTGQDLQNGNLYTHTNAFGPPPRFFLFFAIGTQIISSPGWPSSPALPVIRRLGTRRKSHLRTMAPIIPRDGTRRANYARPSPGCRSRHRSSAWRRTAAISDPSSISTGRPPSPWR